MDDFMSWMELSALGRFMRTSSPWTYPAVNLAHIFGIAALFGSTLIIDLRLLGFWRHIPLGALARATVPVAAVGFAVAASSGAGLLATQATEYIGNPFILIKFPAIALGVVNVLALNLSSGWRARREREPLPAEERALGVIGAISLACWLTAITAGRMIAYW